MSQLPLALMNRLNKTKSAFHLLDTVFPKDPLIRLFRDHNFCHCAVALNLGLGSVRDVASAISSHELTQ